MKKLNAKLVFCSVPTSDSKAARAFYSALLGSDDFARSLNAAVESYYRPLSDDGLQLNITQRFDSREPITCFFAVNSLDAAIKDLAAAGGKVVTQPADLPIQGSPEALKAHEEHHKRLGDRAEKTAGRMVTMLDPDGNYIGLVQLSDSASKHFLAGKYQNPLRKEQVDDHENWKRAADSVDKK